MKLTVKTILPVLLLLGFISCKANTYSEIKPESNSPSESSRNFNVGAPSKTGIEENDQKSSVRDESLLEKNKALVYAAQKGDDVRVKELVGSGADVDYALKIKGSGLVTPLTQALSNAHESTAEILISAGADVNLAADFASANYTENNASPLNLAARNGLLSIVKLLVEKGADVNHSSSRGATALMTGDVATIKYLLEKGANPNVKNSDGDTPLIFLTNFLKTYSEDEVSQGIAALLGKGARTNAVNKKGESALTRAEKFGAGEIANMLKNASAKSR